MSAPRRYVGRYGGRFVRRYVVVGAGAIGGGVGGLLHAAGLDVVLVARGEHLRALQDDGLRLRVGHEPERVLRVSTVGAPGEAALDRPGTVVLLATKSHQTAAAVDQLVPHLPPDRSTPVVSLQNGVANERELLRHLPAVHGVVVMMPASHLSPGRVQVHSAGRPGLLDVGRWPVGVDEVDHAVAADLRTAGFDSVPRPDAAAWKHRKLLLNLGNAVDAACAEGEAADELVRRARAEGEHVLAAAGVPVTTAEDDAARRGTLLRPLVDRDVAGSSTWQSLARGAGASEVDHLNGEVVLLGRLHGVPTPVNTLLQHVVVELARTRAAPRSLDAATLLDQLDQLDQPDPHPPSS